MEQFINGIYNLILEYQAFAMPIGIVAVIGGAVGLVIPSTKAKEWGKAAIGYGIIGMGVIICATPLVEDFARSWGGF